MALLFDANTEYLSIADDTKWNWTPVSQQRALSIWYKTSSVPNIDGEYQVIFTGSNAGVGNSWQVVLAQSSSTVVLFVQLGDTTFATIGGFYMPWSPTLNQWYHIVLNCSTATNNEIWIDGVQQTETDLSWDDATLISPVGIMCSNSVAIYDNETLAHLAWFGSVLTETEIDNLAANPYCMDADADILCSIHMDEMVDTTANDVQTTATQTDGTLTNSPSWVDGPTIGGGGATPLTGYMSCMKGFW